MKRKPVPDALKGLPSKVGDCGAVLYDVSRPGGLPVWLKEERALWVLEQRAQQPVEKQD